MRHDSVFKLSNATISKEPKTKKYPKGYEFLSFARKYEKYYWIQNYIL